MGVAIGDLILDLSILEELGHFRCRVSGPKGVFRGFVEFVSCTGTTSVAQTREILQHLLSAETATLRDDTGCAKKFFTHKRTSR